MNDSQGVEMHDYLFDVKLFACVRVRAPTVKAAREAMAKCIDCVDLSEHDIEGVNKTLAKSVRITEVSIAEDGEDENREPVEIDGEYQ